MLKYFKLAIFISLLMNFCSCKNNNLQVDVSDIQVSIEIKRFDIDLFNADIENIENSIEFLQSEYGYFYDLFNHRIIEIGGTNSINYSGYFIDFLTDYTVNEIMVAVRDEYKSMADIERKTEKAFKHYKYYFPEKAIPEIITFISGFNQSIVIDENLLAIGLDKYLGAENQIYKYLGVSNYKKRNMHRDKIVSDCMRASAITEYEFHDSVDNLVNNMIYEGIIMYFVDAMLPDEKEGLKIGFTEQQLNWCKKNEQKMWTYFIEQKLLFSTEYMQIKRYIDDSPFTTTFSHDSPGRTGVWIGWQIVKNYMKHNKKIKLKELMEERDYQKILNFSKYKP